MMRLPRPRGGRQRESTIALINIVFLMLIFFLIAGTLAPPMDSEVALIKTADAERAEPPDALFVTADGQLRTRGEATDVNSFVTRLKAEEAIEGASELSARVAADRDLPATRLVDVVAELREAGVGKIRVVTERAAE